MAGSLNRVQLLGNLGQDPEIKSFQNGGRIANLRIATSEQWKDKNTGERKERTEWHTVTLQSDGLVGVAERYLRKGSKVFVEGQLRTRKWQDRSGNDRYSTEVAVSGFAGQLILLGDRGGGAAGGQRQDESGTGYAGSSQGEWDSASGAAGGGGSGAGSSPQQRLGGGHASDSGGGGSSWRSGGGFADDLDDDIPF